MIAFYIALKVGALLAVVLLPLIKTSRTKQVHTPAPVLSSLVITENGYLHYLSNNYVGQKVK
ncbi:hypothetical protein [Mucilaginibacter polytrichastri]|uniref:Uncharacterized protein n=1 Tax=Mucilaginibacter polytrichastri TaxID=1302689 RepID=A0A1Q5ZSA2_9SPHI|nr:hypothetical protein [Mucilaginibacter polytrichastri]OKS84652.1 hypothetical protein RG47T_0084 [Mucilaginibacter polytrichastri]